MHIKPSFKFLGATLACLIMAACGGGAGTSAVPGAPGASSSSTGTNNSTWRVGTGTGASFIPTKLTVSGNANALFIDQTVTITANIVDDQGALISSPASVVFSSPCLTAKTSTITGGNTITSVGGVANAEYKAGSCFGDDVVTATVNHDGTAHSGTVTLSKVNNKKIGSGSGASFVAGQLTTSTSNTLYKGDTVQITASLVDNQNAPISQTVAVAFTSDCINNGTSSIVGGNVVTSTNGVATVSYKVDQCNLDDKITAAVANGASSTSATTTLSIDNRRIGSGFGSDFTEGNLEVGVGSGTLAPGGTTTITAYLVNSKGDLVTDALPVTFSSDCLSADDATIANGNVVTATNGKAIATYTSKGCAGVGGVDRIKASTTFRGIVLSATANLAVKADTAQTITFIDATPTLINIKGTGGTETSILKFRVLGQGGSPLKGVCVNFAPSTIVGDLALVPSKCNPAGPETFGSTTDINGYATTTVQAGTVATVVRVTATILNNTTTISTQSSALAVTTGVPDQNSTSLSLTEISPIAWDHDGVTTTAIIRMADAFNNPVPKGTAVTFTASGGSIDGSCSTLDNTGVCSVTWRSQNPRPKPAGKVSYPQNPIDGSFTKSCSDGSLECRAGRVEVLATAIGNESFIDGNGNGLYDDIEKDVFVNSNGVYNTSTKGLAITNTAKCSPTAPNSTASVGITNSCDDLREAYVDKNFNNDRDFIEEFIDFNKNGIFDPLPNGKYDGALCAGAAKANGDCTSNKVSVRDAKVLVMSCETPFYIDPESDRRLPGFKNLTVNTGEQKNFTILLADCNGNGMPKGTTVSVNSTNLLNATATIDLTSGLAESQEPTTFILTIKSNAALTPSGNITLNITTGSLTTPVTTSVN